MRQNDLQKPQITVVTVNYNTADFIELMLYSLEKLTANSYQVIICDNGSVAKDIEKLRNIAEKYNNLELIFRRQNGTASIAHGQALDILIERSNSKYTVVLDSDCVFLLKNWDLELIKELDEKVKIVGATSCQLRAGDRVGGGDFPLPFAALFETDIYRSLGVQCVPEKNREGYDTCWQWKQKFTAAGFNGKTLIARNTRDFKQGPFYGLVAIQEYYLNDGRLAASHFGRGSSNGAAKYFKWLKIPILSRYIKSCYGRIEKKKWINKCFEMIDGQCLLR
jgi:glycosyltransferase involved in cell wall biosynthesis